MSKRVTTMVLVGLSAAIGVAALGGCEKKEDPLKKAAEGAKEAGNEAKKAVEGMKK